MKDLIYFYENPPAKQQFFDRKVKITSPKTVLIGAPNSGKSAMIVDYLYNFNQTKFLYINLDDIRCQKDEIFRDLSEFYSQTPKLQAIAIDGVLPQDMQTLKQLNLPPNVIISSRFDICAKGFETKLLNLLDFEEFVVFYRKNYEIHTIFSHFLIHGNGSANAMIEAPKVSAFLQNYLLANLSQTELFVLMQCGAKINETFSTNSAYTQLKKSSKISKDTIYAAVKFLEESKFVVFLSKFGSKNSTKRVFFSDFAYKNALDFKKDFKSLLSNALFCELLKLQCEIYYTDEFDFYLPSKNLAILIIPFSANEIVFLRFKNLLSRLKELKISRLKVISVANSDTLEMTGIKCEILPFWRFVLSL